MAERILHRSYESTNIRSSYKSLAYIVAEFDGDIKALHIYPDSAISGTATFDLSVNGVSQLTGNLLSMTDTRIGEKTGLDIPVVRGDIIRVNTITVPSGGISRPISVQVTIDDGLNNSWTEETIQDLVAAMMTAGSHTSWVYNDAAGTLSVDAVQLTDEEIQDKVAALLQQGSNITLTYNDGANTLEVASTGGGSTDEEIQDMIATFLQQGSNVTLTYNDGSNTLTVAASGGGSGGAAQNSQSADYTLVIGDAQGHIYHPVGDNNPRTWTIPANSSVAFPVGTMITFVNRINVITIAITTDTLRLAGTSSTGSRSLAANGMATAIKTGTTEWMISGTGIT